MNNIASLPDIRDAALEAEIAAIEADELTPAPVTEALIRRSQKMLAEKAGQATTHEAVVVQMIPPEVRPEQATDMGQSAQVISLADRRPR